MKLNSQILEPKYSVFNPEIARDRFTFMQKIKDLIYNIICDTDINDYTNIDLFKTSVENRDDVELNSIYDIVIDYLNNNMIVSYIKIFKLLSITKVLVDTSYSKSVYNKDAVDKLKIIIDRFNSLITDNFETDATIDNLFRYIGSRISFIIHKYNNDLSYDHRYITPLDRKTDLDSINELMTESIDGGVKIKSIANYSDTRYFPQLTSLEFSPADYMNGIYHESDDDYIINRIKKLPDFLKSIITKENCYDAFVHICEYLYDKFAHNSTALNLMIQSLIECRDILHSMLYSDYSQKDSCERLDSYCEKLINFIDGEDEKMDEKVDIDSSPLIEMGFGYIYDIIPSNIEDINENTIDKIGKAMIEAAEYYDIMNVLSEASYNENKEIRKQIKRDTENDIYRQRLQDKYSDERRALDDRYSDKRRRKSDDYEFKRREEQDKYEKKKEEKERKKNATKTAWSRWKTMELTNSTVYAATRALKRLISATAVGGVAYAAGFNPVFLPIVYLLSKYMGDHANPEKEKLKIMKEIKSTQNIIDSKIEQADRQNDMKQKYQLMRMRDKLESQFKQMGYNSTSGIGGKV